MMSMMSKRKNSEKGFTLIELIMVIVIIGIISAVAVPRFLSLAGSARLGSARGVGGAINGSIQSEHAEWLINGQDYDLADVLSSTNFTGGIAYNTTVGAPAVGEITEQTADTNIQLNLGGTIFEWDWTVRNVDTAAIIAEDATSPGFTP